MRNTIYSFICNIVYIKIICVRTYIQRIMKSLIYPLNHQVVQFLELALIDGLKVVFAVTVSDGVRRRKGVGSRCFAVHCFVLRGALSELVGQSVRLFGCELGKFRFFLDRWHFGLILSGFRKGDVGVAERPHV